ncbi:hypothetical protein R8871_00486 [Paraburkholderia graminis C4D1M]|jgi:hypothetical protein|uniref:Uncharacterized protein n=1 Tax=Paraburkholderia graminis (strain ATCC 700544 / DSM 17151 / LMG 18924 / NCIMB 13744 / C4D1M) TaxID=396598 RepID=B1G4Y3_PARG4|nr:hypothetical protein BgramDRAFT_4406 [Paraburkholderia graminis C4D1M]CAB3643283.1 hypothetical protein R8871_00486 [Paraburkholderia graminis C4D1M]
MLHIVRYVKPHSRFVATYPPRLWPASRAQRTFRVLYGLFRDVLSSCKKSFRQKYTPEVPCALRCGCNTTIAVVGIRGAIFCLQTDSPMPVANTTQDYASDKCRQVEPYRIGSTDEPPAIGNLEYMFFTFFSQSSLHQSGALPCDVAKTQPTADHADLGSPVDVGAVCSRQRLQRRHSLSCCN